MTFDWFGRHPVFWSYVGALGLAALLGPTLGNVIGDEGAHLSSHLTFGVPAWLLFASGFRFWPRPRTDRYSRIARHGLLIAIAILATGVSFEAVGALGSEEMLGIPWLSGLHPAGVVIGAAGIALTLSAVGLNILVWGMARAGKLQAAWMPYAMGLVSLGGIAFITGAFIFDY